MIDNKTAILPRIAAVGTLAAILAFAAGCGRAANGGTAATGREDAPDAPLVLAIMPELPPYAYADPDTGEIVGIDVDIVRAAAARLGRPLEIRQMRFADVLPSVKAGTADFGACGLTITEGRSRDVDFSIPYAVEGCVFLYRADDPPPTMIRAETLRVGVVQSMTADFYLTRHGIEPFRYKNAQDVVDDVLAGRLDAMFYDRPALAAVATESGGALAITPLETRENYGIAVRKNRPNLLDAVNGAIRERNAP